MKMKTLTACNAILFLLLVATFVRPQQQQEESIRLKTDLVTVTAQVTDRGGRVTKSLRAEDFIIYEDGIRQKVAHFASTEEPFAITLLLDISGSTQSDIELIKRAARGFLSELRRDDRISVVVFSREITRIAEFEDTRRQVEVAIDEVNSTEGSIDQRFNANTGTSFYDALRQAATDQSFKNIQRRKAIVCMSDGVDSTSRLTYREVAGAVEKSGASVYFLALNTEESLIAGLIKPRSDPGYINLSQSQIDRYYDEFDSDSPDRLTSRHTITPETRTEIAKGLYRIADRDMKQMAERAGGRVYPVSALTDLAAVYKQVADNLRSQYTIGYYPDNDARDGRWRTIRVEVRQPDASVRARSGYWAK
jgi:VWFA-related protein